ncbi:MAG: TIGR03936 family radical SAM-associated protein, partial [Tissierellaceae bacterium]
DLMRLFHRTFNKAKIPIGYSEGFNPHPKFSIANPLALGIESDEEYIDIELDNMEVEDFIEKMNLVLPKDVQIIEGKSIEKGETIDSLISWAHYEIEFELKENIEGFGENLMKWLQRDEINIDKIRRKKKKEIKRVENIRPLIGNLTVKEIHEKNVVLNTLLKAGSNGNLKPMDLVEAMNRDMELKIDLQSMDIRRTGQYAEKDNNIFKPL